MKKISYIFYRVIEHLGLKKTNSLKSKVFQELLKKKEYLNSSLYDLNFQLIIKNMHNTKIQSGMVLLEL